MLAFTFLQVSEAWEGSAVSSPRRSIQMSDQRKRTSHIAPQAHPAGAASSYQVVAFSLSTRSKVAVFTVAPLAVAVNVT